MFQIHTYELHLRHLFEELYGKTKNKTGRSEELGKLLKTSDIMERDYSFKVTKLGPELNELAEDVVKDLSPDRNLLICMYIITACLD